MYAGAYKLTHVETYCSVRTHHTLLTVEYLFLYRTFIHKCLLIIFNLFPNSVILYLKFKTDKLGLYLVLHQTLYGIHQ